MMNHYNQIPPVLDSIYKFFQKHSTYIMQDIVDIVSTRRKFQFIENTQKFFKKKTKNFLVDVFEPDQINQINIYGQFQLMEFGHCCLVGIFQDKIIIYSASNDSFFWGNQQEFFVNGTRCFQIQRDIERNFECTHNSVPDALIYGLFRSYSFDKIKIHDENLLSFHNNQQDLWLVHHIVQ